MPLRGIGAPSTRSSNGSGGWGFSGGGGGGYSGGGGGGYSGGGGGNGGKQGAGGGSFVSNWAVTSTRSRVNGSREDGEALYLAVYSTEICTSSLDCNANGVPDDCDLNSIGRLNDFESGIGGYQLNGTAIEDSGSIRLTSTGNNQSGSVIFEPVAVEFIDAFSVEFDFFMGGGSGADGMSFVLVDALETGNDLLPDEGGANQPLVVSLDTYGSNAADGNHAILRGNGVELTNTLVPFTLDNGQWYNALVVFENGELTVVLTNALLNSTTVFDSVPVPGFTPIRARYGFGARTGGATNTHRVDNVRFKIPRQNDCDANGVPDDCESDTDNDGLIDSCDNCPNIVNTGQADSDNYGIGNVCDICPGSNDALDADGDSIPDGCDTCPGFDDSVDTDGDSIPDRCDACPGSPNVWNASQDTYHATITAAIAASNPGDEIELGACTFNEWGMVLDNKDITICGQGRDATIIDADYNGRIFRMQAGDASTLEDLTLRRGVPVQANGGAAIQIVNAQTVLRRVEIRDCDALGFTIGAVDTQSNTSNLTAESCRFLDNVGSAASSAVGGFGEVVMTNCLFAGNSGAQGTIDARGTAEFYNCTFADNLDNRALRNNVTSVNCIFDGSNPISVGGDGPKSYSLFPGGSGTNIDGVPTFVDAANGDYSLAPGSLGIDAGDYDAYVAAGGGTEDLNGNLRTFDSCINDSGIGAVTYLDLGAFELQSDGPDSDGDGTANTCDVCDGFDDSVDTDGDGLPDGCEACANRQLGDVNGDSVVSIDDVASFVSVLLDPASASTDDFCAADVNEDLAVNGSDIQAMMSLLLNP